MEQPTPELKKFPELNAETQAPADGEPLSILEIKQYIEVTLSVH